MKVYVVLEHDDEMTTLINVFSTYEGANDYVR